MTRSVLRVAAARLPRIVERGRARTRAGCRCPALRSRLDEESAGSDWLLHPDGVLGRALLLPAGATITVPLKLAGEGSFSARAMLLPHDWRDGRGAVRASVAVTDAAGRERELWSGPLRASDWGRPRGLRVDCWLPDVQHKPAAQRPRWRARCDTGRWRERSGWSRRSSIRHAPQIRRACRCRASRFGTDAGSRCAADLGADPGPRPTAAHARRGDRLGAGTDVHRLGAMPGRRRLHPPRGHRRLGRHAASDPRIHLKRRETAGGISVATNAALELATGEYIALLDHDDTLAPDALATSRRPDRRQPDLDMIYSDEDVVVTRA